MNGQTQKRLKCLLGIDPNGIERRCDPAKCRACGWEKSEAERRKRDIERNGLTLCDDGLRRYLIPRRKRT